MAARPASRRADRFIRLPPFFFEALGEAPAMPRRRINPSAVDPLADLKTKVQALPDELQVSLLRWALLEVPSIAQEWRRLKNREIAGLQHLATRAIEMNSKTQKYNRDAKPRNENRDRDMAHLRYNDPKKYSWKILAKQFNVRSRDPAKRYSEGGARSAVERYVEAHPDEFPLQNGTN
jgi:hypothetical protein